MSSVLYYSNFCNYSKTTIQQLNKIGLGKDVHFICIDKRVKEGTNVYIVLENGQKIIMPPQISRVPALLLLNKNYTILYGEHILGNFKQTNDLNIKTATNNNLEPSAFSLGNSGFGIVSDNYSFLDMNSDDLAAKGNGGIRQMHNYVDLNFNDKISTVADDADYKGSNKMSTDVTIEKIQKQREQDFQTQYKVN
jgi:hypothetical protein